MKEVRYFYVPGADIAGQLPEEEAAHAIRVLRLQAGDGMMLMDGNGMFYQAVVTACDRKRCLYRIERTLPQERQWARKIQLAIAPTKMMERMEWMLEKATEVGIDQCTLLDCRFSERKVVKTQRLEKIIVSAAKQSRKAWMPEIIGMTPFEEFVRQDRPGRKYIAHCYEEIPRSYLFEELQKPDLSEPCTVLVGPEGDFSMDEVELALQHGYTSVHLGKSRLRTETAGLAAVMMMHYSTGIE